MAFKAVLFDLDGTLLDTLEDIADSANEALRTLGFPPHPVHAFKELIGGGVANLARRAVPAERGDPETLDRMAALFRQEYAGRWDKKTRPYPGVAELLDALGARGIPMAVLSNKPDQFTQLCVARLLSRWTFQAVLGERDGVPRKPDPTGAAEIARRLGFAPRQILYLGDTKIDMQTAVSAGMHPVGALWGFQSAAELTEHGARVLIDHPRQVLGILNGGPCP